MIDSVVAPRPNRKAIRASSRYVRKTALLTCPIESRSRKRTVSRWTNTRPWYRRVHGGRGADAGRGGGAAGVAARGADRAAPAARLGRVHGLRDVVSRGADRRL